MFVLIEEEEKAFFTVTSKARSIGAHPLSGILILKETLSIVHCAEYRAYCIAALCHFPRHEV